MRLKSSAPMLLLGTALVWSIGASAQEPWIDAGPQAMIMHNGALLEQQTAPNNGSEADGSASPQNSATASLACSMEREREKLRPEYERRVRADGQQAAMSWLRQEAAALGRQAGAQAKAGERC